MPINDRSSGFKGLAALLGLAAWVGLLSGCCTQAMAASVGKAARDSFFQEQERQQQHFLQVEADALKDTITSLRDGLDDPRTRAAFQHIADDLTATANRNLQAMSENVQRAVDRIDQRLRDMAGKAADEANETFKRVVSTAVTDARTILQEQPILDETRREELRRAIQPLVSEIIADSGEQARVALQKNVDQLSFPLLAATGGLLVLALLTMGLPSLLLFLSYRRSIAAIQALKTVAAARQETHP